MRKTFQWGLPTLRTTIICSAAGAKGVRHGELSMSLPRMEVNCSGKTNCPGMGPGMGAGMEAGGITGDHRVGKRGSGLRLGQRASLCTCVNSSGR